MIFFPEFLMAERLKETILYWLNNDNINNSTITENIYDLLGYGGLKIQIISYLFELLEQEINNDVQQWQRLSEILENFYDCWRNGKYYGSSRVTMIIS
jgi:hypothetical protein